jgi:hypothetical protein
LYEASSEWQIPAGEVHKVKEGLCPKELITGIGFFVYIEGPITEEGL